MAMSILQAIVLGLLQGFTEFLPVSSSGHLVLVPWLLRWEIPSVTYDAVVHLGTLFAVIAYFRRDIVSLLGAWWQSLRQRRVETSQARLAWLLLLSTIPAMLAGYFLGLRIEPLFANAFVVSLFLLVTGILVVIADIQGQKTRTVDGIGVRESLIIGLAQALAIAPGISRSGATISAGLFCGLQRSDAARFSFLMAIPIIAGAATLKLVDSAPGLTASGLLLLGLGFVAALLSGYVAIRLFLGYVRTHSLRPFAFYCWALGLLGVVLHFVR